MALHCLIDWLSFTLPKADASAETVEEFGALIWARLQTLLGGHFPALVGERAFSWSNGRAPYLFCLRRSDKGVSIFFDRRRAEILVEMTGTGCQVARVGYDLEGLALHVSSSVTRIDLTVDIPCDTTPNDFVSAGFAKRFKSGGRQFSESGETFYVGSWSSNRFARVYRYSPPHPRSKDLRVEHVFRDESATAAVEFLRSNGLVGALAACGEIFGWRHDAWVMADAIPDDRLSTGRDPKASRDTVFWVYRSVVPALARLLVEKRLSWDEFESELHRAVLSQQKAGSATASITSEDVQ